MDDIGGIKSWLEQEKWNLDITDLTCSKNDFRLLLPLVHRFDLAQHHDTTTRTQQPCCLSLDQSIVAEQRQRLARYLDWVVSDLVGGGGSSGFLPRGPGKSAVRSSD